MELEKQGLRLYLVLGNAYGLNCGGTALTAIMLSSLLELFAQVTVLKGDVRENGYKVVDAEEGNGNNQDSDDDDGEDDEESSADDAEGKETEKGPVSGHDDNGEAGDDDHEPEGDDDHEPEGDDDDDDDNHENDDEDDDGEEDEDEDEDEDGTEEEEDEDEEALQPPKKRKK